MGETLAAAARGALVRALLWLSHSPRVGYMADRYRRLARMLGEAGGRVLLDHRGRPVGSHHQKAAVVREHARLARRAGAAARTRRRRRRPVFAAALHRAPRLHLVAVVPRYPDQESPVKVPAARFGQGNAMELVRRVGGDRVQVLNLEREDGTPIYVHAKLCVVDDAWAAVGSANLNRRSWTHDSELVAAVLDDERDTRAPADPAGFGDGARRFARELRLALMREHLGRGQGEDDDLVDPDEAVAVVRAAAEALDGWHESSRSGPRPAGRLRSHPVAPGLPPWARAATTALYQSAFDPDGRPYGMRLRRTF